ncbi:hypothetical protein [Sphingomonas oleivorans]|uniref:hypothetical protein n=1 Tax=Sphingomonas oleivorans TaxID=1735121 RepID=UPI001FAF363B|nr:hypothetical protein [Sphingomonas oleivorans]
MRGFEHRRNPDLVGADVAGGRVDDILSLLKALLQSARLFGWIGQDGRRGADQDAKGDHSIGKACLHRLRDSFFERQASRRGRPQSQYDARRRQDWIFLRSAAKSGANRTTLTKARITQSRPMMTMVAPPSLVA